MAARKKKTAATKKKTASTEKKKTAKEPAARKKASARTRTAAPKKTPAKRRRMATPSAKEHARRADYGTAVATHLAGLSPQIRGIVQQIRELILVSIDGVEESIKWGMPVYGRGSLICYIGSYDKYVRFGFYDRNLELADPEGLLEGSGMKHIKLRSIEDVKPALFRRWLRDAAARAG